MTSPPAACQCLFCNHLNPAGASFCNECGSQLQLQQCELCGSINKRSARHCYKCGAPFIASRTPVPAELPPAAASAETSLPESVARALEAGVGGTVLALRTRPPPPSASARSRQVASEPAPRRRLLLAGGLVALIVAALYLLRAPAVVPDLAPDAAPTAPGTTAPSKLPAAGEVRVQPAAAQAGASCADAVAALGLCPQPVQE